VPRSAPPAPRALRSGTGRRSPARPHQHLALRVWGLGATLRIGVPRSAPRTPLALRSGAGRRLSSSACPGRPRQHLTIYAQGLSAASLAWCAQVGPASTSRSTVGGWASSLRVGVPRLAPPAARALRSGAGHRLSSSVCPCRPR
jgi:hypothetical protein